MEKALDQLIADIDSVREEMEKVVARTDPSRELCPGWTIKEAIAHITAWEIVIHKAILAFLASDPPYFLHEQDFDVFNQEAVDFRAGWSLQEVIKEWKDEREKLRESILKIKEEDLPEELVLPWGSERSLAELIEIIAEHEGEHMENIEKVISG
jgi:hypothetical protein